jgi:hypothetical protein
MTSGFPLSAKSIALWKTFVGKYVQSAAKYVTGIKDDRSARNKFDKFLAWSRSVEAWREATNREEIDPDSDLTDLIPALSRLIGWLNEGKTCEQAGMRVKAFTFVVRPDL